MKRLSFIAVMAIALSGCCKQSTTTTNPSDAVLHTIMTRVSVRAFTGEKITDEQIETLLRSGMSAPTAMNRQPWAFMVVTDEAQLDSLGRAFPFSHCDAQPACAIIVCGDMTKTIEGQARDFWVQDVSAATENILLAAHAMGLGAVWTGLYPTDRYKQVQQMFGMPEGIVPLCIIPIGVPAEQPEVKQKYDAEKVHFNCW